MAKKKETPAGIKIDEKYLRDAMSGAIEDDMINDDDGTFNLGEEESFEDDNFDLSESEEADPEEWKYDPTKPIESHRKKKLRIEEEANSEISDVLKSFKASAKKEAALMEMATDSEFWVCVCFKSRDHKDEFLARSGLEIFGDKYVDGHKLSAALSIPLETQIPKKLPPFRKDKEFASLAE